MAELKFENVTSSENVSRIRDTFSKYVVTPSNAFGIAGFVFDVPDETVQTLQAEITDHFVEDNSAVQDHIALRPLTLELGGFVGELVYENEGEPENEAQKAIKKLVTLEQYVPTIISSAKSVKNAVENPSEIAFEDTIPDASDLYALVKNANPSATRQQQAYMFFKALYEQRVLMSVQTPFELLTSMAIESVTSVQSAETRQQSSFSVSLKQIRKTEVKNVSFNPNVFQGKASNQRGDVEEKGKAQGVNKSFAAGLFDGLYGG